jgi:hypothetical protein
VAPDDPEINTINSDIRRPGLGYTEYSVGSAPAIRMRPKIPFDLERCCDGLCHSAATAIWKIDW